MLYLECVGAALAAFAVTRIAPNYLSAFYSRAHAIAIAVLSALLLGISIWAALASGLLIAAAFTGLAAGILQPKLARVNHNRQLRRQLSLSYKKENQ